MDAKLIAGVIIGALVIGGGSFYGGMQYAQESRNARFAGGAAGQQFAARAGAGAGTGATARFNGAPLVAGTILAKDQSSITVQLGGPSASSTNGSATGSKIVLYNGSTQLGKFDTASTDDLKVGEVVTVTGAQNNDGSITAQMIQIRPAGAAPGGRGQ